MNDPLFNCCPAVTDHLPAPSCSDIPHLPAQMPADSCDLNVRLPVSSLHPSAPSPKRNIWRKLLRRRWQSHSVSSDEGGQA